MMANTVRYTLDGGEVFDVPEPWYLASCDDCGWIGSSEECGTDTGGDDSDVYCPKCSASGADCGAVSAKAHIKDQPQGGEG